MTVDIIVGDCREKLRDLPAASVHTCVTSPPYFGLRDYGHGDQIGLEPTPDEFVAALVGVFREVRRVLRDDGTLWLNLGDSYASGGGVGQPHRDSSGGIGNKGTRGEQGYHGAGGGFVRPNTVASGLKPKDLIGIPWRVAFALQADGWYLRQDIIWHKPNPMPESVQDRCTKSHEYIFLLSKSPRYYFDAEAISEAVAPSTVARLAQDVDGQAGSDRVPGKTNGTMKAKPPRFGGNKYGDNYDEMHRTKSGNEYTSTNGKRNRRSVWTVTTKPFKGAHFATFPPDLIEPCILAGCPAGGTVLDPFGGAGTTGITAEKNGRNSIIIELNPKYARMAADRIRRATKGIAAVRGIDDATADDLPIFEAAK